MFYQYDVTMFAIVKARTESGSREPRVFRSLIADRLTDRDDRSLLLIVRNNNFDEANWV